MVDDVSLEATSLLVGLLRESVRRLKTANEPYMMSSM